MKFKPYPYQSYAVERVIKDKAVGLFLDMGLGKTAITLIALADLMFNRFEVHKVLVIAPKKVAESTWTSEAEKWEDTKLFKFSSVLGSVKKREKALYEKADIYLINRENVTWLVDFYKNAWPFDMVVIDELSSFKSYKSKRFKSLRLVRPKIKRIVGLTGTPSPNSLSDLWSQIYLLDEGARLGKSYTQFRDHFFIPDRRNQHMIYSYKPSEGAKEQLLDMIKDLCISMKSEDYLQLPDILYHTIPVTLDDKARKSYNSMEKQLVLSLIDKEDITALNMASLSSKLLQISSGAIYDDEHKYHEVHDCKIERLLELIEALQGKPLLIFYGFKHDKDRILKALEPMKLSVSELKTHDDILAWNQKKIDVLLTHPASSGYGLNLQQGGNHVCWFSPTWNYELYLQANKRLHRQGQQEKVVIHHLIATDTRDEDVMKALELKENVQNYVLDSLKARIDKYTQEVTHARTRNKA